MQQHMKYTISSTSTAPNEYDLPCGHIKPAFEMFSKRKWFFGKRKSDFST